MAGIERRSLALNSGQQQQQQQQQQPAWSPVKNKARTAKKRGTQNKGGRGLRIYLEAKQNSESLLISQPDTKRYANAMSRIGVPSLYGITNQQFAKAILSFYMACIERGQP
jgi:hypothetical protein